MKLLIFLFLCLFFTISLNAQQDTIYWRSKTYKISDLDLAKFYQVRPFPKKDSLYEVKNYFLSGKLHMLAYWSNPEEESFQGKAIWYYEDGQKLIEANYHQNELEGKFIFYYPDGTIKAEGIYKKGRPYEGVCAYGYDLPEISGIYIKKEGKDIGALKYYVDSKQIAERYISATEETICYDKKGKEVARANTLDAQKWNGTKVIFDQIDDDHQVEGIKTIFTYLNGRRNGDVTFFHKDKFIAKGIYKDREPWEGDFAEYNSIETYKEGILFKKTEFHNDYDKYDRYERIKFSEHLSEHGRLVGERIYYTEKGEEIARGFYKDNKPWSGTFRDEYSGTVYTFKNGKKVGPYIEYAREDEWIESGEIKNGKKNGTVEFRVPMDNSTHQCQFVDGKPFDGTTYDGGYLLKMYSEGDKVGEQKLDQITGKPFLFYTFENDKTLTRIYQTKDKTYKLNYKDGDPYDGFYYNTHDDLIYVEKQSVPVVHIDYFEFENGVRTGPFKQYQGSTFLISGTLKNNLLDGLITFHRPRHLDSLQCFYKDGNPITGKVWDGENLTEYKNGKKDGVEILNASFGYERPAVFLDYNKIHKTYKNGVLDGPVLYYNLYTDPPTKLGEGLYKNGQPYDGIISEAAAERIYQNGKIISHAALYKDKLFQTKYKNGQVENVRVILNNPNAEKDLVICEGTYKNDQPYEGTFVTQLDTFLIRDSYDGIYPKITYTDYRNGKKDGKEQIFFLEDKELYQERMYRDGSLAAQTIYLNKGPIKKVEGFYKNNKPYNGFFLTENESFKTIMQYKNGVRSDYQYYLANKSYCGILFKNESGVDSVLFQNGKPYDGKHVVLVYAEDTYLQQVSYFETSEGIENMAGKGPLPMKTQEVEYKRSKLYRHTYKNGKRIDTYIHDSARDPDYIITYTPNGFEALNYYNHYTQKVSFKVVFNNKNQSSGTATFFNDESQLGYLKFVKGTITELKLAYTQEFSFEWLLNKKRKAFLRHIAGAIRSDFYPDFSFPKKPTAQTFIDLIKKDYPNGTYQFGFVNEQKPFTSTLFKQGRFYDGYLVDPCEKEGLFEYRKYKNGEFIKEDRVTKEALLKMMDD